MNYEYKKDKIIIIDFGSQVTKLIARRIRDYKVYSEILTIKDLNKKNIFKNVKGIILSGGPSTVIGKKLFDNKQFKDSKFYFEKNIVFNPKSEKSYLYLAKIFNKEQKNTLEEENLNTVILLNPLNEEAIYLLTILNIEKSNFSKAKELMSTMASVCKKMCPKKKELQEKLNNAQQSK